LSGLLLLQIASFVLLPVSIGYLILRPLHERSRLKPIVVRRFTLIDFAAFAIELQVLLAICLAIWRNELPAIDVPSAVMIGISATVGMLTVWWAGVEAAGRADVSNWKRRLTIHLVLLPGTIATMLLCDASLFAICEQIFGGMSPWADAYHGGLYTLATIATATVSAFLLHGIARWVTMDRRRSTCQV
jgi:hypothetical protein